MSTPGTSNLIEMFKAKAQAVGTIVTEADNLAGVLDYALEVARNKPLLEPLLPGPAPEARRLAAPGLPAEALGELTRRGLAMGLTVIGGGLRDHLAGIDLGLAVADLAVAETATVITTDSGEDARLAGMISEVQVVAVDVGRLVETGAEAESLLRGALGGAGYVSFISGCSRTSDIERVLTLGVHGPLEMHVVLMKGPGHGA